VLRAILSDLSHSAPMEESGGVASQRLIADCPVVLGAIRGYYPNTFLRPELNDYNIYDDAAFVFVNGQLRMRLNWNTDPGRVGINKSNGKFYAQLMPGVYMFRRGPHKPGQQGEVKRAFRQMTPAEALTAHLLRYFAPGDPRAEGKFRVRRVERDQGAPEGEIEWGLQNINIHPGGKNGTSSAGCQTAPDEQFYKMRDFVYEWMEKCGQVVLPYVLLTSDYAFQ